MIGNVITALILTLILGLVGGLSYFESFAMYSLLIIMYTLIDIHGFFREEIEIEERE